MKPTAQAKDNYKDILEKGESYEVIKPINSEHTRSGLAYVIVVGGVLEVLDSSFFD